MRMYNRLEYSGNYFLESRSLQNYYRDEAIEDANEYVEADHYRINNNKIKISKSFECKTKIVGSTPADNYTLNKQVVIPIKYF